MARTLWPTLCCALFTPALAARSVPQSQTVPQSQAVPQFEAPVRLVGGGELMKTDSPGYAAPCVTDIDGDRRKDIVVGQFHKGRMKVYRGLGGGKFSKGEWLMAAGDIAEVPGVW